MKVIKKIITNFWFVGIVGGLIANFLYDIFKKYRGESSMDFLYIYLWEKIWPFWIGLAIALIYKFIKFLVNIGKSTSRVENLNNKIDSINGNINELKEWIGLLKHKDKYSDLRGKIRFFAREELEKNTTLKK
jgi:hypothetical protein